MKLFLILLLLSFNVLAETIVFTPPREREDDTLLDRAEISGYEVRTYVNGVLYEKRTIGNVTAFDVNYPPGVYGLYMQTIDTGNRWSDSTPRYNLKVVIASPKPPVIQ